MTKPQIDKYLLLIEGLKQKRDKKSLKTLKQKFENSFTLGIFKLFFHPQKFTCLHIGGC